MCPSHLAAPEAASYGPLVSGDQQGPDWVRTSDGGYSTPPPTPRRRRSGALIAALIVIPSVAVLLLGFGVIYLVGQEDTVEPSEEALWPLGYDFDDGTSDMGITKTPRVSSVHADGGLLMTVRSADPPPVHTGVNFWDSHPHLAVQMDMIRRSGPVDGTAYGPSCWTGDKYFTFLISDDGGYQVTASDYSSADFSTAATTTLEAGSDPSLVGTRSRLLRIECDPSSSTMSIKGYADGQLVVAAPHLPSPARP